MSDVSYTENQLRKQIKKQVNMYLKSHWIFVNINGRFIEYLTKWKECTSKKMPPGENDLN